MKDWSLLVKRAFKCLKLLKKSLTTCLVVVAASSGAALSPDSASIAAKCSSVKVGGGALLYFAILCKTSIASASLPRERRNFGDS